MPPYTTIHRERLNREARNSRAFYSYLTGWSVQGTVLVEIYNGGHVVRCFHVEQGWVLRTGGLDWTFLDPVSGHIRFDWPGMRDEYTVYATYVYHGLADAGPSTVNWMVEGF